MTFIEKGKETTKKKKIHLIKIKNINYKKININHSFLYAFKATQSTNI
jgi:hypothetical protein